MPMISIRALLLIVTACAVSSSALANEAELVYEIASPSIAVIETDHGRLGSGVAWHANENITFLYTNCHTLKGAHSLIVRRKGERARADFLYGYVKSDLCVIVTDMPLAVVVRRSFDNLRIGESVYAIGSPMGLELTLSTGVVSQLRGFPFLQPPALVQTTAPISPGSSGGGLFDSRGRLVGITSFYLKDSQGLNFAVSPDTLTAAPKGELVYTLEDLLKESGGEASKVTPPVRRDHAGTKATPDVVRLVNAAIMGIPKLRYVRVHQPEIFNEIVAVDDWVRTNPHTKSLSLDERFRRSVRIWEVLNDTVIAIPPEGR